MKGIKAIERIEGIQENTRNKEDRRDTREYKGIQGIQRMDRWIDGSQPRRLVDQPNAPGTTARLLHLASDGIS